MRKVLWYIIPGIALIILIIYLLLFFIGQNFSNTLEVSVIDAVSKSWVYNSTIRLQDRVIRGFKSTSYTFRNLKTGSHLLSITAPYYESKEIKVSIHNGKNSIKEPIELKGYTIPNLESISIFEKKKDDDIFIDIRLVGNDGHAVSNHPCLPVRILVRISVQLVDGEYEKYTEGKDLEEGKLLYSGEAPWIWNTGLSEIYKYSAYIPIEEISVSPAPYLIVGYLILLPNPLHITTDEVDTIVREVLAISDQQKLDEYLAGLSHTIDYYFTIKTNVENLLGGNR